MWLLVRLELDMGIKKKLNSSLVLMFMNLISTCDLILSAQREFRNNGKFDVYFNLM